MMDKKVLQSTTNTAKQDSNSTPQASLQCSTSGVILSYEILTHVNETGWAFLMIGQNNHYLGLS